MQVGDLVMDVDPHYSQQLGIIVEIDAPEVRNVSTRSRMLTAMHLDVVSSLTNNFEYNILFFVNHYNQYETT